MKKIAFVIYLLFFASCLFAQDYPGGCFSGATKNGAGEGIGAAGSYARKHNPAISFTAISSNPSRCARIANFAAFDPAAAEKLVRKAFADLPGGKVELKLPPAPTVPPAGEQFVHGGKSGSRANRRRHLAQDGPGLGIEPYLLAGTINLIIAQRLVRQIHAECGGKGCVLDHQTGLKGRVAIRGSQTRSGN